MYKCVCIFIFATMGYSQLLGSDKLSNQEKNVTTYEKNKIVVAHENKIFESKDEWLKHQMMIPHPFCHVYILKKYWTAFKDDTKLTEIEFFTITGFPEKADEVRSYLSKVRIMKWSSPFLIIGGIMLAGFSSGWGSRGESNVWSPTGLGISVLGIVFGLESLSNANRKKHEIRDAIDAMDTYNSQLKANLGLKDSIEVKGNKVQTTIDTSRITVMPLYLLDEKPTPVNYIISIPPMADSYEMTVDVLIDTNGSVIVCDIFNSSGNSVFDSVVLDEVQKTTFTRPTMQGLPVRTRIRLPIKWRVQE